MYNLLYIENERQFLNETLHLREKIVQLQEVFEEKLISILLEDEASLIKTLCSFELNFNKYYVLAMKTSNHMEGFKQCKGYFKPRTKSIISLYHGVIYAIIETEEDLSDKEILIKAESVIEKFKDKMKEKYNIDWTIAFEIGDGIQQLKKTVLKVKSHVSKRVKFNASQLERLVQQVEAGDQEALKKLKTWVEQLEHPIEGLVLLELYEILTLLKYRIFEKQGKCYFQEVIHQLKHGQKDTYIIKSLILEQLQCYISDISAQQHNMIYLAESYIQQNYNKDLSLEEISERLNLSPYYFSKLFKQETGVNFIDFLTKIRIREAKKMIKQGKNIKEVAKCVGYSDPNYFSRVFKKATGVNASQYRYIDIM